MEERLSQILDDATEISSGYQLDDVDTAFRVLAGPGAGKTHWLVSHIEHVVETSDRLGPSQRIGCISYTTAAAEEIERRLGSSSVHVDVSTIHSFLYRNIVKPYLPWVRGENGKPVVDYWNVDGHSPHEPVRGIVNKWLQDVSQMQGFWQFDDHEDILEYLRKLRWEWSAEKKEWILEDRGYPPEQYFPSSESNLRVYKEHYWQAGIIDHSDVLFFAVRILNENPGLARLLSRRYPYVFVDEFQDTTPAQTGVLTALTDAGTVTGVIGDVEQSVFQFAGANPNDLLEFEPEGQKTYHITENRRSTSSILRLLNHIRLGSEQTLHTGEGGKDKEGRPPTVLVGPPETARHYVREKAEEEVQVLTRKNSMVRYLAGEELPGSSYERVWKKLFSLDTHRAHWMEAVLEATHEAKEQGRYGQAVNILYRALRTRNGALLKKVFRKSGDRKLSRKEKRRAAASLLPFLLTNHDRHQEMNGLKFYRAVCGQMERILPSTPMKRPTEQGKFGRLLGSTSYKLLYTTARLDSGAGQVKTVHKSKGEEYTVVLAYRRNEGGDDHDATLQHLLYPEDADEEERRVTYVAFSRAKDQLFICVDEIGTNEEQRLKNMPVNIEHIDGLLPSNK